jgi:hypothetical protein
MSPPIPLTVAQVTGNWVAAVTPQAPVLPCPTLALVQPSQIPRVLAGRELDQTDIEGGKKWSSLSW